LLGPLIADIALKFGSQEYFIITLWGLSLIAILSKGVLTKGIISGCIGLFHLKKPPSLKLVMAKGFLP